MRYLFYTADVFTDRPFGGNQLAVFPHAEGLTPQQMQQIAKEFNLSETVFVLPPQTPTGTRWLKIFTPNAEVPFAGHPTVGTAYVLGAIGEVALDRAVTQIVFEEGVGAVPVKIFAEDGKPTYTELSAAKMPEFNSEVAPLNDLAAMLSLDVADLRSGDFAAQGVSCGMAFLFIPLTSRAALQKAKLDRQLWEKLLGNAWANNVYIFCNEPELPDSNLRARMFAPALGISEDPATGAAATALAGYLGVRDETIEGTLVWVVEQGFEIDRPSLLRVEADKHQGEIQAIRVGGASVMMSEGWMEIR
jgi:trans-2,3-dihydro-3-hydroxyanthranilate isomerase